MQTLQRNSNCQTLAVVGSIPLEILAERLDQHNSYNFSARNEILERIRKEKINRFLYRWTRDMSKRRPFIKTQWKIETEKIYLSSEKRTGKPLNRKEKSRLRVQSAVKIAEKYKDTRF